MAWNKIDQILIEFNKTETKWFPKVDTAGTFDGTIMIFVLILEHSILWWFASNGKITVELTKITFFIKNNLFSKILLIQDCYFKNENFIFRNQISTDKNDRFNINLGARRSPDWRLQSKFRYFQIKIRSHQRSPNSISVICIFIYNR